MATAPSPAAAESCEAVAAEPTPAPPPAADPPAVATASAAAAAAAPWPELLAAAAWCARWNPNMEETEAMADEGDSEVTADSMER